MVIVALELDDTRLARDFLVGNLKLTVDATAREYFTAPWCSHHVHFTVVLRAALALHIIIFAGSNLEIYFPLLFLLLAQIRRQVRVLRHKLLRHLLDER